MKVQLQNATKSYNSLHALDDVSVEFEEGQIVALVGSNGAGKTTLLRSLAGIIGLDAGKIFFDEEHFLRKRTDLRRRYHFLPDFPAVFESWSPLQHIGMALRLYGKEQSGIEERVLTLLRDFDLLPLANAPFATLSRGQRYKAVLVALLAIDPELWLLDEPFASGMDPHGINAFKRYAREAAARGRTIIYSTQILDAAERFSDRVCVIHRGKIRWFGTTMDLQARMQKESGGLDEIFSQLREEETV